MNPSTDAYPIDRIRQDVPVLHELCYLNTGTVGVMNETVLASHLEAISHYERYGHAGEAATREGYETGRAAFARLLNARPEEIALTRNASDGINYVVAGLDLPAGSTIVTTTEEHPAVLHPLALAARKSGVKIRMISLDDSDEELLKSFRSAVSGGDVKLAIFSHVSCETGRRLPVNDMCNICRAYEVLSLVDAAQSLGQFPVDVQQLGCDFTTGNGHKWLCGPKGTGFLHVRADRTDLLSPSYVGDGSVEPRFDRSRFSQNGIDDSHWAFRGDAWRFEFGTRNWHLYKAIADAVRYQEEIGWELIYQHVDRLSTSLKHELAIRSGVTVHTPDSWADSCGIVTFSVDGWDGVQLAEELWQTHNIIQRRVQIPSGVRISVAHYTNEQDIEQFLTALDQIRGQASE